MNFKKRSILVANNEYQPILFYYKKNHPQEDVKFMRRNELINFVSYSFKDDPIPELIKKGYDYNTSKKYMNIIQVGDFSFFPKVNEVFNIIKDYIQEDELGKYQIEHSSLYLFEMQDDLEIQELLKRKGIEFTNIKFEDLDINKPSSIQDLPIYYFPDKYAQYFYIFSDIRKRIKEDENIKDKIKILINDNSDLFYLNVFSSIFNISICYDFHEPLISSKAIKDKLSLIYKSKSLDFILKEDDKPELKELKKIIDFYKLKECFFDFGYANLLEIINSINSVNQISNKGISVTNKFNFHPDCLTYVTNFQYDSFYKVFDDKNVFSDEVLAQMKINPSYVKTTIDRNIKLNYIQYNQIVFLSRVEQHLSEKIYDSQFVEEFNLRDKIIKKRMNENGLYTSQASDLYNTDLYDKKFYFKKVDKYNSYDHSFKGLQTYKFPNDHYSVTNLEGYIDCPFKYYLNQVIPDSDFDRHAMCRGTLIHSIFEDFNHKDQFNNSLFDFEKSFKRGLQEYIDQFTSKGKGDELTKKEEAYLEVYRRYLSEFIKIYNDVYSQVNIAYPNKDDEELELDFILKDDKGREYKFSGRIDKILYTKNPSSTTKYYTIIDYKTGSEEFYPKQIFLGKSIQLPLYLYGIENNASKDKYTRGYKFGGLGIQHVYFNSFSNAYCKSKEVRSDNLISNFRLKGIYLNNQGYIESFDLASWSQKGKKFTNRGNFFKTGLLFTSYSANEKLMHCNDVEYYNLETLVNDAKNAAISTINKIEKAEFFIKPTSRNLEQFNDRNVSCTFCSYKDVCYHNKLDYTSYVSQIKARFEKEKGKEKKEDGNETK